GYALVRAWIQQGAHWDGGSAPRLTAFEIRPEHGSLQRHAVQQLAALARYSDGSVRDVTALAAYEANDKAMADVDARGLVTINDMCGNVAVMARYQGQVAVYRATVPLGAAVENLPAPTNFIDEHVLANLRALGIPPSALCDDATFLRRATLDIAGRLP